MSIKCTWLGQGGFLFVTARTRMLIDPYLSDAVEKRSPSKLKRLIPPPFKLEVLKPDFLFCTHDHLDHYDPETAPAIMKLYPDCVLLGPSSVISQAKADGIAESRMKKLERGESFRTEDFSVQAIPALHSDPLATGLIFELDDRKIYLSGDSEYFPGLAPSIGKQIDIAFICINGKYGNMNWQEALSVIKEIRPGVVIPMHYGMFAENTLDPSDFLKECSNAGLKRLELFPGITVEI